MSVPPGFCRWARVHVTTETHEKRHEARNVVTACAREQWSAENTTGINPLSLFLSFLLYPVRGFPLKWPFRWTVAVKQGESRFSRVGKKLSSQWLRLHATSKSRRLFSNETYQTFTSAPFATLFLSKTGNPRLRVTPIKPPFSKFIFFFHSSRSIFPNSRCVLLDLSTDKSTKIKECFR